MGKTGARAGMGCVMGSKNLKAIIVKASGTVPVADKEKVEELAKRYGENWCKGRNGMCYGL